MSYQVKLSIFEGPFDLLFHLIEKEEIDIYDIPIARLTQGYIDYLGSMEELDVDRASEFLLMASTLIAIKAKLLLPKPHLEEQDNFEEDPRTELIQRLLVYKEFRDLSEVLKELEEEEKKVYTNIVGERPQLQGASYLEGISLSNLLEVFQELMESVEEEEVSPEFQKEKITVKDRIQYILLTLERSSPLDFKELFSIRASRTIIVVTFIALLELVKAGYISVAQEVPFDDISIEKKNDASGHIPGQTFQNIGDGYVTTVQQVF